MDPNGMKLTRPALLYFSQSKRSYEQKCREADEAEQAADKINSTTTPKQAEKVKYIFTVVYKSLNTPGQITFC